MSGYQIEPKPHTQVYVMAVASVYVDCTSSCVVAQAMCCIRLHSHQCPRWSNDHGLPAVSIHERGLQTLKCIIQCPYYIQAGKGYTNIEAVS